MRTRSSFLVTMGLSLAACLVAGPGLFAVGTGEVAAQMGKVRDDDVAQQTVLGLRLLFSDREGDVEKGEAILRRLGVAAVPGLRDWVRRERGRLERVELFLDKLLRELSDSDVPPEPLSRDSSAEEFFKRRLLHAQLHLQAGRYEKARGLAEAILTLDPKSPLRFAIQRVVREARQRLMERKLEPRVDIQRLVYEVGDRPDVRFRLHNRSPKAARVTVSEGVIGELYLDFDRRFALGEGRTERRRVPLRLDKGGFLELAPGRFWEHQIDEGLLNDLPLKDFVGRVRFRVTFRPTRWEIEGEDDSNIPLESKPSEFWVVPPGKSHLAEDPLTELHKATLLQREEDFLIASWLCSWASEDDPELRDRLVDHLVSQLAEIPPQLARVSREVLESTTGRSFRQDVEWRNWWSEHKLREQSPPVYGDLEPVEE